MKVFEIRRDLPKQAGKAANLHFASGAVLLDREGSDIKLPGDHQSEFFPLRGGEQFLFRTDKEAHGEEQIWFGGTDEKAFLVRLNPRVFFDFMDGGERAFFKALQPKVVQALLRRHRCKPKRQGDIFAVPMRFTWDEFVRGQELCSDYVNSPEDVEDRQVLRTRHEITGKIVQDFLLHGQHNVTLVSGILRATDHEPLNLRGIHAIAQAANLYSPEAGD